MTVCVEQCLALVRTGVLPATCGRAAAGGGGGARGFYFLFNNKSGGAVNAPVGRARSRW